MSTYTRSKYNVYMDGVLIASDQRPVDAAKLVDCDQSVISAYAKHGTKFHGIYRGKRTIYTFSISKTETHEVITKEQSLENNYATFMDEDWRNKWNAMRTAVKLLKTGHGKIVTRKGKKVTVMI